MQRFSNYSQLDDTPLTDGDNSFIGFWSRHQPTFLQPGQLSYSGNGRLERGTFKVRKGLKALSNDISLTNPTLIVGGFSLAYDVAVTSITRSVNTATVTTTTNHGYSTGNRVNIRGANQSDYNGDYTITVTGLATFTYTVANSPVTPATGTIYANKGPRVFNSYTDSVVGSGDVAFASTTNNTEGIVIATPTIAYLYRYGVSTITIAYPAGETAAVGSPCVLVQFLNQLFMFRGYATAVTAAVTSITRSTTTATVTTTAAHGLSTGDWVTIAGAAEYQYNGIFQITVTGGSTFTYTMANAGASPATGTITSRPCKPPLVWDMVTTGSPAFVVVPTGSYGAATLIKMPAVDWGIYFKGRFILPYSRDQLVLSDVFDPNTYNPTQTQFRILPGTNDWLIASFPYQEAKLLVLYRKSVHLLLLDGTDLSIAQAVEVTRNFGCVARTTIANCGEFIVWLSDLGVMQMQIGLELSLTNANKPLSDPIQDIIDTINWTYAANAVAVFWNNRYYVAVPTGSSTTNNLILVYNFLNQAWESADLYPQAFQVLNFHLINYNGSKRIHAVSTAGYVSLMEEEETDEFGAPGSTVDYPIIGSMYTRNYLAGTYDVKKVKRFQLDANVDADSVFTGDWVFSNPDLTTEVLDFTATSATDVSLRATVNRRGVSGRLELTTSSGRPEFKAVTLEASITTRGTYNLT